MLTILVVNMNIFITHIYDITMILKNHMFNMHLTIYFLNASKNYKLFFFSQSKVQIDEILDFFHLQVNISIKSTNICFSLLHTIIIYQTYNVK